jgi:hypothetical protein
VARDFRMEQAWTFPGRDGILISENAEKRARLDSAGTTIRGKE